jgi:hypothetical protein
MCVSLCPCYRLKEYIEKNWQTIPVSSLMSSLFDPTVYQFAYLCLSLLQGGIFRAAASLGIPAAELQPVEDIINVATQICQRSMESEKLWFSLLDRFVQLQRNLKNELKKKSGYNVKVSRKFNAHSQCTRLC